MTENIENTESPKVVVAFVEDHPKAIMLLRMARRKAQEIGGLWRAIAFDTPTSSIFKEDASRERILRLLTIAEQMGGEVARLEAENVERGLELLLQKEQDNLALVVVGSTESKKRKFKFRTPSWMRVVNIASRFAPVEVVPLSGHPYHRTLLEKLYVPSLRPLDAMYSLAAVAVAYGVARTMQFLLPPALFRINDQNIALLFMIACAFVAGRYGMLSGLLASAASFLTVNYFFTLPYYILKISTVTDGLNMALFLFAAVLISLFTSQTRSFAEKAARRERSAQALFKLYRTASEAHTREEALNTLQQRLEQMLEVNVAFFLPTVMDSDEVNAAFPQNLELQEADIKALASCWDDLKTTGHGSPFNPGTKWRFEPMISPAGEVGVLGVKPRGKTKLDAWFGQLITAIADQTSTVLQHIGLERSMEEARLSEEREKLRALLLSSVSHDFKTPLAGIIGALSVHRSLGKRLSEQKRDELIETAIEEAQRLDNFITNILDMTRLESGNIQFRKEWHNVKSMIEHVTERMQNRCKQHMVVVEPCPPGIEVCLDIMMTEQVIQNLIDNACKYTAAGSRIEIACRIDADDGFLFEIRDNGAGIPTAELELIFNKYSRLHKKDSQVAGTGLGLAIARSVMKSQGGWITAANHSEGGAVFTLCLPEWRQSNAVENSEKDKSDAA